MIVVSEENIEKSLAGFEDVEEAQILAFMEHFSNKQPILFAYMIMMQEELDELDGSWMVQLCAIVLQSFEYQVKSIPIVTEKELEKAETSLMESFSTIMEADEKELLLNPEKHAPTPTQPFLLRFILEEVLVPDEDEDPDDEEFDLDARSTVFSVLQVFIEAMHQALNKPRMHIV